VFSVGLPDAEGHRDLAAVSAAYQQDVQQKPCLEGVEEAGPLLAGSHNAGHAVDLIQAEVEYVRSRTLYASSGGRYSASSANSETGHETC
jgi:hypothetical protein